MEPLEQASRARIESRYKGAWAFIDGDGFNRANVSTNGRTIFSYGHQFPMAHKIGTAIYVSEEQGPGATNRHLRAIREVLGLAGYAPSEIVHTVDPDGWGRHEMRRWEKTGDDSGRPELNVTRDCLSQPGAGS